MVNVSIEVRSGTARFSVAVRAQSIRRAASIVGGRYARSGDLRVKLLMDPEGLCTNDPAAHAARTVWAEQPERIAA